LYRIIARLVPTDWITTEINLRTSPKKEGGAKQIRDDEPH
jgi:hypothetical protein